jgi:hypothetical protein
MGDERRMGYFEGVYAVEGAGYPIELVRGFLKIPRAPEYQDMS